MLGNASLAHALAIQARIAHDVGRQNCRQAPLDPFLRHRRRPYEVGKTLRRSAGGRQSKGTRREAAERRGIEALPLTNPIQGDAIFRCCIQRTLKLSIG